MSLAFLAAGLAYFLFPLAGDLPTSAILAAVVGLSFGTLFSVSAPLVADCFGLDHFGAIFGLTFAAYGFLAGPLGPTLSGYLLDLNGDNFVPIFLYLGAFSLLAALSIRQVVSPERRPSPRSSGLLLPSERLFFIAVVRGYLVAHVGQFLADGGTNATGATSYKCDACCHVGSPCPVESEGLQGF